MLLLATSACGIDDEGLEQACTTSQETVDGLRIVTPSPCNITIDVAGAPRIERSFSPRFGNNPHGVPAPVDYQFLVRERRDASGAASRKLLVNFMGGGACWSGTNCLDAITNATYDTIMPFITAPAIFNAMARGALSRDNEKNPFSDWTLVFLPYTTADLHWGSNEHTYVDQSGTAKAVDHRGHDNFLAVLRYLRDTYPPESVDELFVMGQSAGAYGAIFNFPYFKEVYPDAESFCLGDAGQGVITPTFSAETFPKWNVLQNLPSWIEGVDENTFVNMNLEQLYRAVAAHYPQSRFAQFTTMYDHNQRFFYYVMLEIEDSSLWDFMDRNGFFVPDAVTCDWKQKMLAQVEAAKAAPNYRAFIAPGEVHTITTADAMHEMSSAGVSFTSWLEQMLTGDPEWKNVQCESCEPPPTGESPEGLECPAI